MKWLLLLLLLAFNLVHSLQHQQGHSVKLKKKASHHKHHHKAPPKFLDSQNLDPSTSVSVELQLQKHENFYLAEIEVGEPPQNFSVLIDTGSPNLILTSTLCQQESCHKHGAYNPQLSSTSFYIEAIKMANGEIGNEIDIQFASGSVEGVFFEDHVCLNSYCVDDQLIIGIVEETEDIFSQMKFDGILGLGRMKEAVVANASFIHNLKYDNDCRNFSLYLSPVEDSQTTEFQSELVLGGISSHLIAPHEEFYFFDVTTEHLWTISIRAIYLGNTRIDNCDTIRCSGLIDSGTSFISFSNYPMDIFFQKFGVYQPCTLVEQFPDLTFEFDNNIRFSLSGRQYFKRNIHSLFSRDICIPFVKASPVLNENESLFVLGQPFLVRHYVWFDEHESKIGIAKSRQPEHFDE